MPSVKGLPVLERQCIIDLRVVEGYKFKLAEYYIVRRMWWVRFNERALKSTRTNADQKDHTGSPTKPSD